MIAAAFGAGILNTIASSLCQRATMDHSDYHNDHPWFADQITGNAIKNATRAADNAALVAFYDD